MLLKSKCRQLLFDIFANFPMAVEVWAYGSRVEGTAHDGSDLDLVILSPDRTPLPIDMFLELKEKIRDSNIPILVDLFDWARLPESFHKNIENCHEVLCGISSTVLSEASSQYGKRAPREQTDD